MTTSSTSVENPVNQIAALLGGSDESQPEQVESVAELLNDDDNGENQEPSESLKTVEDAPEMEATDENPVEDDEVVDTLNNLADELEIDIADMYALNLNLSNDESISLGGLKDFYESNKDIETERTKVKELELALQSEAESVKQTPQLSNELLQARAQVMSIQDQYNRTDWNALRAKDQGAYAALQQDFQLQFNIAKQNEADATTKVDTHLNQARQLQQDRLFDAMPELKDESVRVETAKAVTEFAGRYGFTPQDVDQIEDSRLMRLLIEASKVTKAQTTAKEKLQNKPPQANRPAASRPVPTSRAAALKRLTEKAKTSGQRKDQTAAVAALLSQ